MYDQLPTHPAQLSSPQVTTIPGTSVPQPHLASSASSKIQAALTLPNPDDALATYSTYRPAGKLTNLKALITGGDSGIGRSVAVLYAMEGADVTIGYLPEEHSDAVETQRIVQEVYGRKCFMCPGDLTSSTECKRLVDHAVAAMGTINILVNNCAYQSTVESIADLTEEQWDRTFKTNVYSYFHMAKYCLPHLGPGDSVINNASINHYVGKANLLDYSSTKGAVVAFTRALANQVVRRGVRVNAVCPGPVWTPFVVTGMGKEEQEGLGATPMGRMAMPSEVAVCFVWLGSMEGSVFSGQTMHPNCGVVVGN